MFVHCVTLNILVKPETLYVTGWIDIDLIYAYFTHDIKLIPLKYLKEIIKIILDQPFVEFKGIKYVSSTTHSVLVYTRERSYTGLVSLLSAVLSTGLYIHTVH